MKKTILLIFIIIILPCLAFYCFIMYKQQREEIENLIWKARIELETQDIQRVLEIEDQQEYIERIARQRLGYANPNEKIFKDIQGE